jgi:flagellar basal-body rod modification protein FlgD
MSTAAINPNSAATGATTTPNSSSSPSNPNSLANENVFLQLLVAQLQYQDPTQPADGTQFITQLAEFTNVSNTTDMAGDLDTMNTNLSTITTDVNTLNTTSNNTSGTNGTNSNS